MIMHKVIYMKPGSGFILDNRTNYSVEDLTPRQDIQESLGTRRIKDGTVHRIENPAEPEGTGTTLFKAMAWDYRPIWTRPSRAAAVSACL
jgi:hypothetical protein